MLRDRRFMTLAVAALGAAAIWANAFVTRHPTLDLTFLDVGEGLCIVMRTPQGKTMVMDCGASSWRNAGTVGTKLVAPYLQSQGVDTIDAVVLSHPHSDHDSGLAGLLEVEPARLVIDIGVKEQSGYYRRFLRTVKATRAAYRIAKRGQTIDMGGGVVAQVLSPDPRRKYEDLNDDSIVLRVTYKRAAFLLAADAQTEAEHELLKAHTHLRAQVLQVGHHGSASATSSEWLAAVRPQVAVISCGRRNEYGHPSAEVIRRLSAAGVRIYRTDKDGAVTISTDGDTIRVSKRRL